MSDKALAQCARALGAALIEFARERSPEAMKKISALHTEMCALYRADVDEHEQALKELANK